MNTIKLDGAVGQVRGLAAVLDLPGSAERLERQLEHLKSPDHGVFVVGRTRVGKSTILNALVGAPILPIEVTPCTTAIVDILHGDPEQYLVHTVDGAQEVSRDDVRRYVAEEDNPGNIRQVRRFEIRLKTGFLDGGLHLFDTPGTESLHPLHERVLLDNLAEADCAIFVYRAPMILPGPSELRLLRQAAQVCGRILLVQNDQHGLPDPDAARVAADVQRTLRDHSIEFSALLRVCAPRVADPGIQLLRQTLREILGESDRIKRRALARKTLLVGVSEHIL